MLRALKDQVDPINSQDQRAGGLHWWPHKNKKEWVAYKFDRPYKVSSVKVYFFDDGTFGGCRVPLSWQLFYKKGGDWLPVENKADYAKEKDRYNKVEFAPVTTTELRLELQLPKENSSGILEWTVN